MHKEAAGIPTDAPIVILVAANLDLVSKRRNKDVKLKRTYLAQRRSGIYCIASPYNRVDKFVETREGGPYHEVACPGIPSVEMPGERYQGD